MSEVRSHLCGNVALSIGLNVLADTFAAKHIVVGRDISGSSAHENHGQGETGEREFVAALSSKSMMDMDFDDGYRHIDGNAQGGHVDEQTEDKQHASEELSEGSDVAHPVGKSQVPDKLGELV